MWYPPTDVKETKDTMIVTVEPAGMHQSQLNASLNNRQLTISYIRRDVATHHTYQQMGNRYGEFRTAVDLPSPVNPDGVKASCSGSLLDVVLTKLTPRSTVTTG